MGRRRGKRLMGHVSHPVEVTNPARQTRTRGMGKFEDFFFFLKKPKGKIRKRKAILRKWIRN